MCWVIPSTKEYSLKEGIPLDFSTMVKLNVHRLLRARGMTAYQLAKRADIPMSAAYRLASPTGSFRRIEARTMDRLCAALRCVPGDLFTRG